MEISSLELLRDALDERADALGLGGRLKIERENHCRARGLPGTDLTLVKDKNACIADFNFWRLVPGNVGAVGKECSDVKLAALVLFVLGRPLLEGIDLNDALPP